MSIIKASLIVSLLFFLSCVKINEFKEEADLVLINGEIFTGEKNNPWVEACAIKDGKFLDVGSTKKIEKYIGKNTKIIDLEGRLVVHGFNDAHVHFSEGGFYLLGINLRGARDEKDFAERIKKEAQRLKKGEWILGGNWDHEAWPSKKYPFKELIDEYTPENPVFVQRLDGHVGLANSLALKLAGIDRNTPNPQGGEIVKDPITGEPTGILKDTAQELI